MQLYVTLGAQRATKILGIFARLDRRDGKPQYLRHIPRIWRYLRRSLIHPAHERPEGLVRRRMCGAAAMTRGRDDARRAMVLAAGLGTRMRPLTDTLPKPLVQVAGKPLLDHVLDRLADAGVETAVVNVHHLADQIESHLKGRTRPQIVISDERGELLDTGGGVVKALQLLGDEPFFHMNSDTLWIEGVTPNLPRLARSVRSRRAWTSLLLLASTTASIGYDGRGDFAMAPDGRLARRAEREVAPFVYAGAAILSPALFADAPTGQVLAQHAVRPRDRGRAAVRPAARRHLDACRHAGRDQGGRKRRFPKVWS